MKPKQITREALGFFALASASVLGLLTTTINVKDAIDMKPEKQSIDPIQRCEICEQKMNPTVKIYNNDTRLCKACFQYMEDLPEIVAKNVERFMIGNVV